MESLLHYLWQYQLYDKLEFVTSNAYSDNTIEIIDPGQLNHHAGPDFFNAKVKVNDLTLVGNIEIHLKSSDWVKHRHQHDPAYDNVILHIVAEHDTPCYNSQGKPLDTGVMYIPEYTRLEAQRMLHHDEFPSCSLRLPNLDNIQKIQWLDRLTSERLEQKANNILQSYQECRGNWGEVFYRLLMRYFGFGLNNDAMEMLARSIPFSIIQKHRNNMMQIEAVLMGQASLLPEIPEDDYTYKLKTEYEFMRHKFSLKPLPRGVFKMHRIRPANFPHRRIAQVASILHREEFLPDKCLYTTSLGDLDKFFETTISKYWEKHYHFKSNETIQNIFSGRLSDLGIKILLINVAIPFIFAYGIKEQNEELKVRAIDFLDKIPAENNRYTRQFKKQGIRAKTAAESQALVWLSKNYCEKKKCYYCQWGRLFLTTPLVKDNMPNTGV